MLKIECNDCHKPISDHDNHIAIPQMFITEGGKRGEAKYLHFCGRECLNSWFVKAGNAPSVIAGPFGNAQ